MNSQLTLDTLARSAYCQSIVVEQGCLREGTDFFDICTLTDAYRITSPPSQLTTIRLAKSFVPSAGLPIYYPLGRYHTLTLAASSKLTTARTGAVTRTATSDDGNAVTEFLRQHGPKRQFFPHFHDAEFFAKPQRLMGLAPESMVLAHVNDRLVGTLGIWDQRQFKQCMVHGYSTRLTLGRPLYNTFATLRGKPRLPCIGQPLNVRYGVIPVVSDRFPEVVDALLQAAIFRLREENNALLLIGLHESDPLLPAIRPYSGREYVTLIYLVYWPDAKPDIERLSARVPYLELGCL